MESELRLRRDGVAWRDVEAGVIALDERSAVYLSANPAAAILWRTLALGATHDELVGELVDAFAIDSARAATDVDAFLIELSERGLLAAGR